MTGQWCRAARTLIGRFVVGLPVYYQFSLALAGDALPAGPAVPASLRIDASKVENTLSPLLYGQFLEYMFQCINGGLHGELVRNRSFEEPADALGLSRGWEPYPDRRNHDPALALAWDATTAYPERAGAADGPREHSLRIDAHRGGLFRHGVCQDGIPVRKDVEYEGYLWLKTTGYDGPVRVALEPPREGATPYAEAEISKVEGGWKRYAFRLRSRAADPLARLAILFPGRGRLWIDQVSLLPADAPDGIRADVEDRVRAVHPGFIRWPGGNVAQDYHWLWGVGPRDQRVTWINLSWGNEPEPSDFGTDEYLRFCRRVGAEPTIVVDIEGRGATADEAADWVEYCNGPTSSRWGAARAANGHPEPYGVKLWELGNEIWGNWVRGHSDAETYAANAVRYAKAMRARDPSIKLIGCGDNDMKWNETVLRRLGPQIDYLAIHHYYGSRDMAGDPRNLMAHPLHFERFYRNLRGRLRELVPDRPIKLAINEWGLSLPVEQAYSMAGALYAGRLMNVFERSGDVVAMTSVSDLVNGWSGGIIQANRHDVFVTSTYLVNKLYAEYLGRERIAAEVQGPAFDTSREGSGVPALDAVASRSADGKQIIVKAVNTDREHALVVTVSVEGAGVGPRATVKTVLGRGPAAFNHFATPDAVSIQAREIDAGGRFTVELPAASVSVLVLPVRG
jgi:alpha-N-arabinofuranosidase